MEGNVFNVLRSSANPKTIHRHNVLTCFDLHRHRHKTTRKSAIRGSCLLSEWKDGVCNDTPQKLTLWTRSHEGLVQIATFLWKNRWFLGNPGLFISNSCKKLRLSKIYQPWPAAGLVPSFRATVDFQHPQLQRHIPSDRSTETERNGNDRNSLRAIPVVWRSDGKTRVETLCPRRPKMLQHVPNGG